MRSHFTSLIAAGKSIFCAKNARQIGKRWCQEFGQGQFFTGLRGNEDSWKYSSTMAVWSITESRCCVPHWGLLFSQTPYFFLVCFILWAGFCHSVCWSQKVSSVYTWRILKMENIFKKYRRKKKYFQDGKYILFFGKIFAKQGCLKIRFSPVFSFFAKFANCLILLDFCLKSNLFCAP